MDVKGSSMVLPKIQKDSNKNTVLIRISIIIWNRSNEILIGLEIGILFKSLLYTLLKIKVLKRFFTAMPQKNHFWFHKEPFSQRFFKEPSLSYLFIIWRTFFRHKEPFVKQKGSSDVKGSLWNYLDKKVLLWHREAPLFLSVYIVSVNKLLQRKWTR